MRMTQDEASLTGRSSTAWQRALRNFTQLEDPQLATAVPISKVDPELLRKLKGIAFTCLGSCGLAFLISGLAYHLAHGVELSWTWDGYVAFTSGVSGDWEPTGLLGLAANVALPLFLALSFDRATRGADQGHSRRTFSIVLDLVTFITCLLASIVAWLTLPSIREASGLPQLNAMACALVALLFSTLAAIVEPSPASLNRTRSQIRARRVVLERRATALETSLSSTERLNAIPAWLLILLAGGALGLTQGLCWLTWLATSVDEFPATRGLSLVLLIIAWQCLQSSFHVWRQTLAAVATGGRNSRTISGLIPVLGWILWQVIAVQHFVIGSYAIGSLLLIGSSAPFLLFLRMRNTPAVLWLCLREVGISLRLCAESEMQLRGQLPGSAGSLRRFSASSPTRRKQRG